MSNHEERLDRYIDALNAGRGSISGDDAELDDLFQTVRQLHAIRETNVPVVLAAGLAGQLRSEGLTTKTSSHPERMRRISANGVFAGTELHSTALRSAQDDFQDVSPPPKHWVRQTAQFVGAALAFTLFGLVLVLVFQGAGDGGSQPSAAPPALGQIAFAAAYDGNADIFLVNADGSGRQNLTNNPANDASPTWSPDGSRIAFVSDRNGGEHVYVMDADGSDVSQLTTGKDRWTYPVWSPDGESIALLRIVSGDDIASSPQLYVMKADGSDARSLTDGEVPASTIAWSPDSSEIAVTIELSGRGPRILVYQADGSGSRALTQSATFEDLPTWSPDGSRIAVVDIRQEDGGRVATHSVSVMDADGTHVRRLANGLDFHTMPAWSPDGNALAVTGNIQDESAGIYVVSAADPNDVRHLEPTADDDVLPTWSPDSRQIAFFRSSANVDDPMKQALMVINADGTGLTEVAVDLQTLPLHAWRPMPSSTQEPEEPEPTPTPTQTSEPVGDITPIVPPEIALADGINRIDAASQTYGWIDEELQRYVRVDAPFIDVGDESLSTNKGSRLTLDLIDMSTPPIEIDVSVYTWDGNNAIPQGTDGNAGTEPWFVPDTAPVGTTSLDVKDPTFVMPETSDRYVVLVEVRWPFDERVPAQQPLFANYAFTVYVS